MMNSEKNNNSYFDDDKHGYVIVTSDEPWSEVWMPQLHYAFQLSKRFNVIFLNPPRPWTLKSLIDFKHRFRKISDRLIVLDYLNVVPLSMGKAAVWLNDKINQTLLKRKIAINGDLPPLIMWRFDMFRAIYTFNNKRIARQIFHVIDPIMNCYFNAPLSRKAELVIVTSPKFINDYKQMNPNVVQIGQGVDLDFYRTSIEQESSGTDVSKDSVLLLGTFTDDIDYKFLKRLADHISVNMVLIGPDKVCLPNKIADLKSLNECNNVYWLGAMPPEKFRRHLEVCKLGIISYDNNQKENNKLRSPLKAIAYLAANKCIISNIDCEIPSLADEAIYVVSDENEYINLVDKCYSGQLKFNSDAVNEYLKFIDYNYVLERIFSRLNEKLPDKI